MTTPAKVQEWLRSNKGNLTDAYEAVGYTGPPLKIKEGSLSGNRSKIRLSARGDNGDTSRRQALQLNPPQTKEEQNQNRRQNYKRSSLRKQGVNVVVDHKIPLKLLAQTVEGMSPEQAQQEIKRLEVRNGPLGNRPGNRQIISGKANELKRQGEEAVQRRLGQMDRRRTRDLHIPVPGAFYGSESGSQIVDRANESMRLTGYAALMGMPLDLF